MSDLYYRLLDGVIDHLRQLKDRGERYVVVSPATLGALSYGPVALSAGKTRPKPATSPASPIFKPVPAVPAASPVTVSKPVPAAVSPKAQDPTPPVAPVAAAKPSPAPEANPARSSEEGMAALRTQALACVKCPSLARARTHVVFGVGDIHASLMFVGEAPGADEDLQGEPFVGKAGQLLTKIIETMGLSRATVYIANILKCRPDTPGQAAGNRKPTPDEMRTCLPYLLAQIQWIKPRVIVALGATAVEGLLGKTVGITKLRGHFQQFQGVPVMPTYHPAYLLRNQSLAVKREVWEDMLAVMETLGRPISEKQRGFFLPKPS